MLGAGAWALLDKCLLHERKDPSGILRTGAPRLGAEAHTCNPSAPEAGRRILVPAGCPACPSQPATSPRPVRLSPTTRWTAHEKYHLKLPFGLHMHAHTCAQI